MPPTDGVFKNCAHNAMISKGQAPGKAGGEEVVFAQGLPRTMMQ